MERITIIDILLRPPNPTHVFFFNGSRIFPIPNPPNPFNHVSVEPKETFTQTHKTDRRVVQHDTVPYQVFGFAPRTKFPFVT